MENNKNIAAERIISYAEIDNLPRSFKERCYFISADCRIALKEIPNDSIDCIITSPPYGLLKDYGQQGQIGFGQNDITEYFTDLELVLGELFRVGRDGATLWLVVDTLKSTGETVALPWELADRAKRAGWLLQDVVIWDKGKSLPWSSPSRFRGVCEYILLLSKGKPKKFDLNAARETENLSPYWIKYPERFHPDGKAPSDLWHFPIPNQGSWSKNQSKHSCPFPVELLARMISISTEKNDVILDPFSGTGSVPTVSSYMGRNGIGIELNSVFVDEFGEMGHSKLLAQCKSSISKTKNKSKIADLIKNLRILKYPKSLFEEISRPDRMNGDAREYIAAFVIKSGEYSEKNRDFGASISGKIDIDVLANRSADIAKLHKSISERLNLPPMNKFSLNATFSIIPFCDWYGNDAYCPELAEDTLYLYTAGTFYRYKKELKISDLEKMYQVWEKDTRTKVPPIISALKVNVAGSGTEG